MESYNKFRGAQASESKHLRYTFYPDGDAADPQKTDILSGSRDRCRVVLQNNLKKISTPS